VKALLELLQKQLVLETFKRKFQTFSFDALLDSCWLQLKVLGISLAIFLEVKKHVSITITCRPNDQRLHVRWGILIYTILFFKGPNHHPCSVRIDYWC